MREMCMAERRQLDFEETERRIRDKNETWQPVEDYTIPYIGNVLIYSRWGQYSTETLSKGEFGKKLNSKRYRSIEEARRDIINIIGTELREALSAIKDETSLRDIRLPKRELQLSNKSGDSN